MEKFVTEDQLRKLVAGQFQLILDMTIAVQAMTAVLKKNGYLPQAELVAAYIAAEKSDHVQAMRKLLQQIQGAKSLDDLLSKFEGTVQ